MSDKGPYRKDQDPSTKQSELEKLKTEVEGLKLEIASLRRKEKWEYDAFKDSSLNADNYLKMLNKAGDTGWELISSERNENYRMFFLKRSK